MKTRPKKKKNKNVPAKEDFEKAFNYALRLLNLRQRSEKELNDKFARKGYSRTLNDKLIRELKKTNLINDIEFARAWVNTRMLLKPSGVFKLKRELVIKGINTEIIETTIEELKNNYDLKKTAFELAERKKHTLKNKDRQKAKKNIYDYLRRRGFSGEIIFPVLNKLFKSDDTLDIDENN
ncbi:MAG: regulatory protein RecX [Candidatus Omnitrophota bacterium]